jgi:F-type H+-transporting ATPase subunit b
MDALLTSLGGLLLRALPTFLLVVVLHFYLKWVFFSPLDKVLEARRQATEGARAKAQASMESASAKAAQYEAAVRAARGEIYKEQENTRRNWRQEQTSALEKSRHSASEMVTQARAQLSAEAAEASQSLAAESDRLAGEIAASILRGRRS